MGSPLGTPGHRHRPGREESRLAKAKQRTGSLGFQQKLWEAASLLRASMDPAETQHVVLGLLFLKYIEDAFEERDECRVESVFRVPPGARWSTIRRQAGQPAIGKVLDAAMDAIERENPPLAGVLPRSYAFSDLDNHSLGKLIDLVSGIGLGSKEHRAKDTLGRVWEYFVGAEGKGGGGLYTPTSVVRLLVEMIEPCRGRVYDPCCGSGGMFVQAVRFLEARGGRRREVSIFGQESNSTAWRMARMNLAVRGIEADLGKKHADTFHEDLHPDLRADFILANPPFNISEWGGERLEEDVRWRIGTPPKGNADFAWVQHFVHHLSPDGVAGFVLANGSMSSMHSGEGEIRRKLVEADLVDCLVACPGQLFYTTQIPVCLWLLARRKHGGARRDRRGQVLFIDARQMGRMETRVHRVLDDGDIAKIAGAYHAWCNVGGDHQDVRGFCKSAPLENIAAHDFVLTPGRYVGVAEVEGGGEPFEEKMARLMGELHRQLDESAELEQVIRKNLEILLP